LRYLDQKRLGLLEDDPLKLKLATPSRMRSMLDDGVGTMLALC
jgi:hypothetical protein